MTTAKKHRSGVRTKWAAYLIMGTGLMWTACTDHVLFQQDAQVPGGAWQRSWKPEFTFEVADTSRTYDVYLDIRHTGGYPYSNLYLFTTMVDPAGGVRKDTVECTLADASGRWYGKGAGFIFSNRIKAHVLYRRNDRFTPPGQYRFTMEQAMRSEELEGVIDVGISVENARAAR